MICLPFPNLSLPICKWEHDLYLLGLMDGHVEQSWAYSAARVMRDGLLGAGPEKVHEAKCWGAAIRVVGPFLPVIGVQAGLHMSR